jgi:hypothetical protein
MTIDEGAQRASAAVQDRVRDGAGEWATVGGSRVAGGEGTLLGSNEKENATEQRPQGRGKSASGRFFVKFVGPN